MTKTICDFCSKEIKSPEDVIPLHARKNDYSSFELHSDCWMLVINFIQERIKPKGKR